MSLSGAARWVPPTEAPLSSYKDPEGHGDLRSYPWSRGHDGWIKLTLDHSRPDHPVVGIQAITSLDQGRLTELLWWWSLPDEKHITGQGQQYVWHDPSCHVLATIAMADYSMLISIRYDWARPEKRDVRDRS